MKKFSTLLITCLLVTCILMIGCVPPPPPEPPAPPEPPPPPPPPPEPPLPPEPRTVTEWLEMRNYRFTVNDNGYIITSNYIDPQGNRLNDRYNVPKTFLITVGGTKFVGDGTGYITITVPGIGTSIYTVGPGGIRLVK